MRVNAEVRADRLHCGLSPGRKWDIYACTPQIPLQNVAPGRYLLRVEAQTLSNTNDNPAFQEAVITVQWGKRKGRRM